MDTLCIDGSQGEGGGQILRNTVSLSTVMGKPVEIINIRAGRKNPGLQAQHLASLKAVASMCGGKVECEGGEARVGSRSIVFIPSAIKSGRYSFDIGTAGSVTLVLQAILPVALSAEGNMEIEVTGGTDVPMAPTADYFRHVFLPTLENSGINARFEILRRGFYPRGGGRVILSTQPWKKRKPLSLMEKGSLKKVKITSISSAGLKNAQVAERQAESAGKSMGITSDISTEYVDTYSPGTSVLALADYAKCILGACALGERGVAAENIGQGAAIALKNEMKSGATVDLHLADQLLLYMAIGNGGEMLVKEVTGHTKTSIWLIEQFLTKQFNVMTGDKLSRISLE